MVHQVSRKKNGVSFYAHKAVDAVLELDACLLGLCGRYGDCVYHLPIPVGYKQLGIVHLDVINILVAMKLLAGMWARQHILIKGDNQILVQVLSTGTTQDPFLAACSRNVWQIAATGDIDLTYIHVLGKIRWLICYHDGNTLIRM